MDIYQIWKVCAQGSLCRIPSLGFLPVFSGRGDYNHTMNHWLKADKDSSSGPEITTHQSRCQQNAAPMRFNSFTSKKPMLHQPFLGREGYSQRNFAMMMTVTRNNCWPIQPSSGETPQR